jgi:hypothetical protein
MGLLVETMDEEDNDSKSNIDKLLENMSRQRREWKAVKSDNTAVPKYLWEEHLTEGSQGSKWDAQALHNLRKVSSWLRNKMLCWWKYHQVLRSYVEWMKIEYKIEDPVENNSTIQVKLKGGGKWIAYV